MAFASYSVSMPLPDEEADFFKHLLDTLDGHSRKEHLAGLEQGLRQAQDQLQTCTAFYNDYVASFRFISSEYPHLRRQVTGGATAQPTPATITNHSSLNQLEGRWAHEARIHGRISVLYKAHADLVEGLKELGRVWTAIWGIYDDINRPGSSDEVGKHRTLFDNGYGAQLALQLELLGERMNATEERITEQRLGLDSDWEAGHL
ncbi:hypothetical protein A1O1_01712 [Capronia coronata CBS 617.96]|uniref:Uncharacterized protein n=1 Tax=Capronia coronata CBS 617.96 TaxID=1182541 RepID=W9YUF3_9EURO|nr:uncharacterized protein A1O1_01712 [Capronia coronata CBS 617.96]EXJ93320.1 hypothetical protein A1O1_01712 [Capronia coronata CBS 617.96]